jgi:hypothetical protein
MLKPSGLAAFCHNSVTFGERAVMTAAEGFLRDFVLVRLINRPRPLAVSA